MPVEPDSVPCLGYRPEGRRLAHVVQQHAPPQCRGGARLQLIEHQERMSPHIPLRVILRRLFHAFHRGNFRQYSLQQASFVQELESTPPRALGQ